MVNGMLLFFPGKNKGMVGLARNKGKVCKQINIDSPAGLLHSNGAAIYFAATFNKQK